MKSDTKFALIVAGKEARSGDAQKTVMTVAGERFWVMNEPDGWVEATSVRVDSSQRIPADVKVFATAADAEKFARRWKGHPWWCKPNGVFEVVPVSPIFVTQQCGWQLSTRTQGPTP